MWNTVRSSTIMNIELFILTKISIIDISTSFNKQGVKSYLLNFGYLYEDIKYWVNALTVLEKIKKRIGQQGLERGN